MNLQVGFSKGSFKGYYKGSMGSRVLGFRGLGFRGLGFRGLGALGILGVWGFRV